MSQNLTHKQVRTEIYKGDAVVSMCNPKGREIPNKSMTPEESSALLRCLYSWRREDASKRKEDESTKE